MLLKTSVACLTYLYLPLYEFFFLQILWDENVVPTEYYSSEGIFLDSLINFCNGAGHKTGSLIHYCCVFLSTDTLALPKLNLQFLTLHDYLLRNLNLFRLESTCKKNRFYSELYNRVSEASF